jgi:mono/diheme cytochrome c family protein
MSEPPKDDRSKDWPLPPLLGEPESAEIHEIHRRILAREKDEPDEGMEPTPWWVWASSVTVLFAMGVYLGLYSGSFTAEAHQLEQKRGLTLAGAGAAIPPPQGDIVYKAICLPCHGPAGAGTPGKYPPLAGSDWVARDPATLARIVLHGLEGPIRVNGNPYNNEMPALGNQLDDAEIAAVLTYIRSAWGNQAGPLDADTVAKIRNEDRGRGLWTADKLAALEAK